MLLPIIFSRFVFMIDIKASIINIFMYLNVIVIADRTNDHIFYALISLSPFFKRILVSTTFVNNALPNSKNLDVFKIA